MSSPCALTCLRAVAAVREWRDTERERDRPPWSLRVSGSNSSDPRRLSYGSSPRLRPSSCWTDLCLGRAPSAEEVFGAELDTDSGATWPRQPVRASQTSTSSTRSWGSEYPLQLRRVWVGVCWVEGGWRTGGSEPRAAELRASAARCAGARVRVRPCVRVAFSG